MNRLAPLIVRRADPLPDLSLEWDMASEPGSTLIDDIKVFATGWLAGVVFFGTFLA